MAGALVYFGALFGGAGGPGSPPNTPLGPCCTLAISTAIPGSNNSSWTYTLSINPASGQTVGDLSFGIRSSTGRILDVPNASVDLLGSANCLVASYPLSAASWSNGPVSAANHCSPPGTTATTLATGWALLLSTGSTNLKGQGDFLVTGTEYGPVDSPLP